MRVENVRVVRVTVHSWHGFSGFGDSVRGLRGGGHGGRTTAQERDSVPITDARMLLRRVSLPESFARNECTVTELLVRLCPSRAERVNASLPSQTQSPTATGCIITAQCVRIRRK